jgi:hypothetical protein
LAFLSLEIFGDEIMIKQIKFVTAAAIMALAVPIVGHAKGAAAAEAADATASTQPADAGAAGGMNNKFLDILAKIFGGEDKGPPIAPAQLIKAEKIVGKLMPDGTLGKMMGGMIQRIALPIIEMMPDMSNYEIMNKSGVDESAVENLDEKQRKEITALFDPTRKGRGQLMMDTMMPLFTKTMNIMEVPMRTGLSRAYARKFSAEQLTQINGFFATPTGSVYASESYALQADPEVMRAMFQAFPVMIEQFKASGPDLDKAMAKLPKERGLADLNDAEMTKLAGLLGVPVATLEEQRDVGSAVDAAAEATDAAAAAAEVAGSFANETGEEPWYNKENWAKATKKKVEALDSAYNKASEKSSASYAAWEDAFNKAVADTRETYMARGWKAEPIAE